MRIAKAFVFSLTIHGGIIFMLTEVFDSMKVETVFEDPLRVNIEVSNIKFETKESKSIVRKVKNESTPKFNNPKFNNDNDNKAKENEISKEIVKETEKRAIENREREIKKTEAWGEENELQEQTIENDKLIEETQNEKVEAVEDSYSEESILSYQEEYKREHLEKIREAVRGFLRYPLIARRMGWEGTVIVCFTLYPDGEIRNLKVEKSSGFEILDKYALKAVSKASPSFPRPVEPVTIVIPITYRLE